jgi:site-specific DNA recombinase
MPPKAAGGSISGRVTNITELCTREECSVRQVNMMISLAFPAPNRVKAAVVAALRLARAG